MDSCGLPKAVSCMLAAPIAACSAGSVSGVMGCDQTAPLTLTESRRDSLRPVDEGLRPDVQWARLARQAPGGFAGANSSIGLNEPQAEPGPRRGFIIRLTRPSERTAALGALLPRLTTSVGGILIDTADVSVLPARWTFSELDDWRRYLDNRVAMPGLQSLSTDAVTNTIRYGVTTTTARTTLERRLNESRVPCGLVTVVVEDAARLL